MFGIGSAELFVVLVIAFFVVGPQRLPEVARMISRAYRYFKKQIDEINAAIVCQDEDDDLLGPAENNPPDQARSGRQAEQEEKTDG